MKAGAKGGFPIGYDSVAGTAAEEMKGEACGGELAASHGSVGPYATPAVMMSPEMDAEVGGGPGKPKPLRWWGAQV
ncbi:hypothetical protein GUJ93_ZPchr0006g42709 [Zizania palustris]|uniref:Uncharacterized protein n=1 Tax=Zizania palustris TaxID=103762 RepID=A0A8J5S964_ZIZPA|nr:hypothetical protein GUJ93_ZPchr0006g42709 [Zizania palustris]